MRMLKPLIPRSMLLGRQCFRYISVERAVENQSSKKLFQCDSWIKLVEKIVIYQRMIPRILFFTRVSSIGVFKKEGETFKYMVMYLQDGVGRGGRLGGGRDGYRVWNFCIISLFPKHE